ncbi:C45 family peptidase [Sinorhizobium meliloti]|uniref:C45 family peptidase n=1 Tax=Rhizobium meliloti TaxID=382 RepID=UPI001F2C5993|nr:C45 family peptidase [Sinorhizobium meliloti]
MKILQDAMDLQFEAINEDVPGSKWRRVFDRHWPAYSRWFVREGVRSRPTYSMSLEALRTHMPKLLLTYVAIVEMAGRRGSGSPPPVHVVPALLRGRLFASNRDRCGAVAHSQLRLQPCLLEGTRLASRFNGKRVVAVVDCLWGVLDGINEDGLVVSLAFGGRTAAGQGFGMPVVLSYVLEFANTTAAADAMLGDIPVHMSYSIALIDRKGNHATVYVNPDRPAEVVERRVSTNHSTA